MKIITLSEAKAHLARYGELCRQEPIIVTVKGKPAFQLAPVNGEEALVEELLESNSEFRNLVRSRLGERSVSASEALRRLK